jgi:hypothetical protein
LQAQIFSGKKVLALAMNFGTFYIFSAVRQLGGFYSALSLAPNVMPHAIKKNRPAEIELPTATSKF